MRYKVPNPVETAKQVGKQLEAKNQRNPIRTGYRYRKQIEVIWLWVEIASNKDIYLYVDAI